MESFIVQSTTPLKQHLHGNSQEENWAIPKLLAPLRLLLIKKLGIPGFKFLVFFKGLYFTFFHQKLGIPMSCLPLQQKRCLFWEFHSKNEYKNVGIPSLLQEVCH